MCIFWRGRFFENSLKLSQLAFRCSEAYYNFDELQADIPRITCCSCPDWKNAAFARDINLPRLDYRPLSLTKKDGTISSLFEAGWGPSSWHTWFQSMQGKERWLNHHWFQVSDVVREGQNFTKLHFAGDESYWRLWHIRNPTVAFHTINRDVQRVRNGTRGIKTHSPGLSNIYREHTLNPPIQSSCWTFIKPRS